MEMSKDSTIDHGYIVGLGASAGGLEALEAFFTSMPVDTGLSFIVIQHLAPDFKSLMDELLERRTTMAIHKSENGMEIEPNSIYLIPPKKEMVIKDNKLILRDRNPDTSVLNLPIDIFFESLAEELNHKAIGIIFSGTGSDGSRGVTKIHERGGLVLSQNPESARFDSMPKSAINTGLVDVVINPNDMPGVLMDYVEHASSVGAGQDIRTAAKFQDIYTPIFDLLKKEYDVEFEYYKPATVARRIERRMNLIGLLTVDDYTEFLEEHENELELLYRDLLIGVTQFFRDEKMWLYLQREIIPDICEKCTHENEIRFWVPACATGEEAYTLAIIVHEYLTRNNRPMNLRIFATDLHKGSLSIAGRARYNSAAISNLSSERVQRFFIERDEGQYELVPEIRRMVVFANHNILRDPPFTKIDFVSCRNLLIYFNQDAQKRAISLIHFSLKLQGILFMGPSESLGDIKHEFEEVHRQYKIYKKRREVKLDSSIRETTRRSPLVSGDIIIKEALNRQSNIAGRDINLIRAYDKLMQLFVPASLLIELNGNLAHTFSSAADYLRTPVGVSSLNILDVIHADLRMALSTGLQRMTKSTQTVSYGGLKVHLKDDDIRIVRVTISALAERNPSDYLLVSIEESKKVIDIPSIGSDEQQIDTNVSDSLVSDQQNLSNEHVRQLEEELRFTKENLQATVEELETSNEELQATNEELMASNEELQSTNEELHSVNEELYTVNREYEEKISELTQLTDDMDNLMASTDIGTIFLDAELKIRKFTPAAARQFSLMSQDIGRPINHLNRNIEFDEFHQELEQVHESGEARHHEVRNTNNRWYLMGLHPYRNEKNQTTGVVITFVDISTLKQVSDLMVQRNEDLQGFAYAVSHDFNHPIRVLTEFSKILVEETSPYVDNDNINSIISEIEQASTSLRNMLDGTLNFSRIVTRAQEFEERSLSSALNEAQAELKELISNNNAQILCDKLPAIQCDIKQITRMFIELLKNAITFRKPDAAPIISVSYINMDPMIKIFIKDNGMPYQGLDTDKVFNIFYVGHDRGNYNGLGLGLAICKRIIERHNGKIAYKPMTEGSEVIIELPYKQTGKRHNS